ncbi:multidrug transporter [Paenibacillus sp. Soil766]|uniref:EamA family transporter n=1 Tax=Paenibacillus sp. Soil766 TaxID=1736404 RepID=UPI00070AAD3E|nr:EamA family transporter [Paenibacillus sp. Soil766]KRE86359.1 multidrug transporter [Paenibacillus sp. Soil766]
MSNIYILISLLLLTLFGSFGGFFLKKATVSNGIINMLKRRYIYTGVFFYVLGAILNIYVLKHIQYSVVMPLTAITYIWTLIIAKIFLGEKITKYKMFGIFLIVFGAVFIGGF